MLHGNEYPVTFLGMPLPDAFCWTRVGTEAGQSLESILRRKEAERVANGGVFFWGIGNAIGPSLRELVRYAEQPEVLFTPIKSSPRRRDIEPEQVVVWTKAVGLNCEQFDLPQRALITSRFSAATRKDSHYALVCFSETPLTSPAPCESAFVSGDVENFRTGNPVGASQVTAVVRRRSDAHVSQQRAYRVLLRARLTFPFFLQLSRPIRLDRDRRGWEESVRGRWSSVLESCAPEPAV
jgi:hypothetical protein